jgi:putative transposase
VSVFRFIATRKAEHSVKTLCRVLGVSRSGFHAWERRAPSDRDLADEWLGEQIRAIHAESRQTYGARRVHAALRHRGVRVGRKRVERLMRTAQAFRAGAEALPAHDDPGAGRSRRRRSGRARLQPDGAEPALCADIKEIPTWEGKLYLASVLDCFSRRVVGWSIRDDMKAELVVEALEMAVARRRPQGQLIYHSDQGAQYVGLALGQRCRQAGIAQSMGSKGDCYDNAAIESYHASLEKDLLRRRSLRTRQEARTALFDYIEVFYNRQRLHSTLGQRSPDQFEREHEGRLSEQAEKICIEEERQAA